VHNDLMSHIEDRVPLPWRRPLLSDEAVTLAQITDTTMIQGDSKFLDCVAYLTCEDANS